MAPLSLQAPSRGSVVSLDSASAAPSRAVEVIASCTRGEAGTLTRRELTRPPLGVDKPTSPIFPWPVEKPLQWRESRAVSSVGRAPRLHRGGRRFEPVTAHHQQPTPGDPASCTFRRPMQTLAGRILLLGLLCALAACAATSSAHASSGVQYGIQDDTWLRVRAREARRAHGDVQATRRAARPLHAALERDRPTAAQECSLTDGSRVRLASPGPDPARPPPLRADARGHARRDTALGERRALAELRATASSGLQPIRDRRRPPLPLGSLLADLERAEQAPLAEADEADGSTSSTCSIPGTRRSTPCCRTPGSAEG